MSTLKMESSRISSLAIFIRRHAPLLLLTAAVAAGIFLHLRNLDGVVYVQEDEARPFALLSSGPLIYLIGRPVFDRFQTQESVFILTALVGLSCIGLFWGLCRRFFDPITAAVAALLYAVWPFRIDYARTLLPATYLEFFFLLALWLAFSAAARKSRALFAAAGAACTLAFFVHSSAYCLIAGIGIAAFLAARSGPGGLSLRQTAALFASFLAGAIGAYAVLELRLTTSHNYFYLRQTMDFGQTTRMCASANSFSDLSSKMIRSFPSALITVVSFLATAYFLLGSVRRKDRIRTLFMIPYLAGLALFLTLACLKLHTIFDRHFVWLVGLVAAACAAIWIDGCRRFTGSRQKTCLVAGAAFAALLFFQSYAVTQETFKPAQIRSWLEERGITRSKVLSSWWQVGARDGNGAPSSLPGNLVDVPKEQGGLFFGTSDRARYVRFRILWGPVYQAYRMGLCRYLLTSGLDLRSTAGVEEALLQNVRPIHSWPHPYASHVHRGYYQDPRLRIDLYDLADVFSPANTALKARIVSRSQ